MNSHSWLSAIFVLLFTATLHEVAVADSFVREPKIEDSELSARQIEILRAVLSVGGDLTKEMHQEFWRDFGRFSESELSEIQDRIQRLVPKSLEYQQALWRAAEISRQKSAVTYTPELRVALEELANSYPKASSSAAEQAKLLLEAAVNQTPLEKEGGSIMVTEELIREVLAGLDGSVMRLRQLSNREWAPRDGI